MLQEDKQDAPAQNVKRTDAIYKSMRNPRLLKLYYKVKVLNLLEKQELGGSTPPDLFIGRFGYPYVNVGPLVPPQFGDTTIYGTPEMWVGKSIPEIVEFRSMLVRGMHRTKITNVEAGRIEEAIRDLGLAESCIDASVMLTKKPRLNLMLDDETQPYGPSAGLKEISLSNPVANKKVERAYSDTALLAKDAVIELYGKGVLVSKIQKALSAGLFGIGKNRKFVPTRWSITAVDDTLGKENLSKIKSFSEIDAIRIYEYVALDNRWIVLMTPGAWSYELVEAWYPDTVWNESKNSIDIFSSYEFFDGRKKYAEIGGCYYAARLAVSELLLKMQRQASVMVLREAHPGYIMPVGVWNVREHVREALKQEPRFFEDTYSALNYISTKFDIKIPVWIKNSTVLRYVLSQKKLSSYIGKAVNS